LRGTALRPVLVAGSRDQFLWLVPIVAARDRGVDPAFFHMPNRKLT